MVSSDDHESSMVVVDVLALMLDGDCGCIVENSFEK